MLYEVGNEILMKCLPLKALTQLIRIILCFFLIVEVNHNHLIYELYLKQLFLENSSKRIIEETGKQ